MFAVALKFGFVLIIGIRAVVTAVLFLTSDNAFALRVFTFVLPLSVHHSLLKPRFRVKVYVFPFSDGHALTYPQTAS